MFLSLEYKNLRFLLQVNSNLYTFDTSQFPKANSFSNFYVYDIPLGNAFINKFASFND